MAKISGDGTYVTVEKGDTLSEIARDYGKGLSYKQLASINGISNPNRIYIGQKIKLSGVASSASASSTSSSGDRAAIRAFGVQSNSEDTLFATWAWYGDPNTEKYEYEWDYRTGDADYGGNLIWFIGSHGTTKQGEMESTFSIPANATLVRFRVKPISKTYGKDNKYTHFTANWTDYVTHNPDNNPPKVPPIPAITKVDNKKQEITVEVTGAEHPEKAVTYVYIQLIKDDTQAIVTYHYPLQLGYAYGTFPVELGHRYKVRAYTMRDGQNSKWSDYSGNVNTAPCAPSSAPTCKATSKTAIYVEWPAVANAESYDIEYTTKLSYFDNTDQTNTQSGVELNHFEFIGLESGESYFFRVRANNTDGTSTWSAISDKIVIGEAPSAPTTWSSTTTAIVGEELNLYWLHNAKDNSKWTYAELELYVDGVKQDLEYIKNTTAEDEEDKTSVYPIDTSVFTEGTKIQWRVRTAGVTQTLGEWSVQRTIDIYAKPSLALKVADADGNELTKIDKFPFYVSAMAGPNTQAPIGYHLTVTSNQVYETVDNMGNDKVVNDGEQVYSKHFDTDEVLLVEFLPSNIDLETGVEYTVTCIVSMNSGLTAEASQTFTVGWEDIGFTPNAEISYDPNTITTVIRPYCTKNEIVYYQVTESSGVYTKTSDTVKMESGVSVEVDSQEVFTTTGEQVFSGTTTDGASVYYCTVTETTTVGNVTLSVYRREFDGTFTELATGLDNEKGTYITDPHPSLDYARYRIVAITNDTGAVGYYDMPGLPIGEVAIIIQWNEEWSTFDVNPDEVADQPAWSGSLLRLPYNISVSESPDIDATFIKYAGRKHPVSYYGTQTGEKASWSVDIPKSDKDTIYALRRLSVWMGDVYVREPSGVGYWAHVTVSFSQKHKDVTIPVSISVTRVEGGA